MTLFEVGYAYWRHKRLAAALTVLLTALGVAIATAALGLAEQLTARAARDARGIDLVVGAKGSPLQLILSAVFHADVPTGNIALGEAETLQRHALVRFAIPLALGDSVGGFRIVGTTPDLIAHYGGPMASGRMFGSSMEAVLGAEAARKLRAGPGDQFIGAHGMAEGGPAHHDHPYEVVGVLAPTGTVLDRLALTPIESVWDVHAAHQGPAPEREITALLIGYRTPLAAASLPRQINTASRMQAASPAFEIARLAALMGGGLDALRGLAAVLLAAGALAMLAALVAALDERKTDIAVMRALGASPGRVMRLILGESFALAAIGAVLGLAFGHGALAAIAWQAPGAALDPWMPIAEEGWIAVLAMALGPAAGLWPAWRVYRQDVARTLSEG
ncbi:MAG: FtsX-like permease family protein [Alphaproteobacteria bacterium]|nr:FtsX-like permease family protein [Alphaproteobacteria bacterium]